MERSDSQVPSTNRLGRALTTALPVALLVLLAAWRLAPRPEDAAATATAEVPKLAPVWRDILSAPIVRPRPVAARESGLSPDEKVVGVMVDGKARAYRLSAMGRANGHLINDVIGDVPVSVAYCDRNECVRAYTGPPGAGPLDLSVAGLLDGDMVLSVAWVPYDHESGRLVDPDRLGSSPEPVAAAYARAARQALQSGAGTKPIPYATLTPVVTTWRDWIGRHPESDVISEVPDRTRKAREPGAAGGR